MIFSNKIIGKNINLIILKIFLWLFHSFNLINEILILLILKKRLLIFWFYIRFLTMSRIFVEDFVNSNQKSDKTIAIITRFFNIFKIGPFFQKTKMWVVFLLRISLIQIKNLEKAITIITRFLKIFKIYSFFQKTKMWVVFSLRISLIQTKNLIKQMQFSLAFSKIIRFFKKRRYESFFHWWFR